jgi:uncharacterized protein YecT (DUF1311 family)
MKSLLLLICFTTYTATAKAQMIKAVEFVDELWSSCASNPRQDLLDCSRDYYDRMDSLLNVVYAKYRSKLDAAEKAQLKKTQLGWLEKRDKHFEEIDREYDKLDRKGEAGISTRANVIIGYTEFVRERVLFLIKISGQ